MKTIMTNMTKTVKRMVVLMTNGNSGVFLEMKRRVLHSLACIGNAL